MADPIVEQVFTVARDGQAISSYVVDRADAERELVRIEQSMRDAMLEPDVALATVTKTTTYGAPTPITS